MFKEEFSSSEMDVEYDDFNCYLVKKIGKKYLSFHRWLMDTLGKIDEEAFKRGCSTKQLVVHHINHNHQDNRIKNLVVVGKEEHKIYHGKEKMYKNGNWKDRNSFEEWYSNHFKNSIEPTMLTFVNKFNKNN
ncbi:hypothetical protein FJZ21_01895 [Candidatus Pacearchaeota archaeon]|nr:hypothetical protein [Candidatus Pacearchaeota archaeon]